MSKKIFLSAKSHMHIFNIKITFAQSFKLIAWELWEVLITQTCSPILKHKLNIYILKHKLNIYYVVILSKFIFSSSKSRITSSIGWQHLCKVSDWLLENSGWSWLHKLLQCVTDRSMDRQMDRGKTECPLNIVKNHFSSLKKSYAYLQ